MGGEGSVPTLLAIIGSMLYIAAITFMVVCTYQPLRQRVRNMEEKIGKIIEVLIVAIAATIILICIVAALMLAIQAIR